jgi:hypothetical protein
MAYNLYRTRAALELNGSNKANLKWFEIQALGGMKV